MRLLLCRYATQLPACRYSLFAQAKRTVIPSAEVVPYRGMTEESESLPRVEPRKVGHPAAESTLPEGFLQVRSNGLVQVDDLISHLLSRRF